MKAQAFVYAILQASTVSGYESVCLWEMGWIGKGLGMRVMLLSIFTILSLYGTKDACGNYLTQRERSN